MTPCMILRGAALQEEKELLLAEYYGVIINRQVLKRAKPSSGMSLIDNWTDGYPYLRKRGRRMPEAEYDPYVYDVPTGIEEFL